MRTLSGLSLALILIGVALLPPRAAAQQTAGSIVGTVRDSTGAVLPGVTVSLTGERVMGTQSVVTDERGSYRFRNLSPGVVELVFELAGFTSVRRINIRIEVGAVSEENVSLEVATLEESVTVAGSTAVIDRRSAKVASNSSSEWIHNAPVTRTSFFDILAHAPGIDPSPPAVAQGVPQPSSFGSTFDQNLFQVDGIDVTSNFGGPIPTLVQPSTDVLEEVEVLSLGAPAEYGNVQGAVFNVVTRQGTNQFRGGIGYYHQSDALTGVNTTREHDGGFPFRRVVYRDVSAHLGGPIARDRVWFLGAYQRQRDSSVFGVAPEFADLVETDHYYWQGQLRAGRQAQTCHLVQLRSPRPS